jgi:hypothetical protein
MLNVLLGIFASVVVLTLLDSGFLELIMGLAHYSQGKALRLVALLLACSH